MEEKTFPFELKEIDEKGVFEGYASIFDKADKMGEIVEKGAFTKTLKEKRVIPMLWYHDPRDPIGVISEIEEDAKGLRVKGELNLDVQSAREKYALMKQKAIRGLSFGFNTVKDLWEGNLRRLKEVKLFEISPCTFQAHPKALVTNVKSFEAALKTLEEVIGEIGEFKSGKMISAANLKLINNAAQALVAILKKLEPPDDTQDDKKGYIAPIFEALEAASKPQPHLLESVFKALENQKQE